MHAQTCVVVGATGTVGTEVVRHLRAAGCRVRALARTPRTTQDPLLEYWPLDLATPLPAPLFEGIDGAFLMAPIRPDMIEIGERLNRAVIDARVPRVVRLSIASVMQRPEIFAGWAHQHIDQDLLLHRPDALVLRPHGFMQNLLGLAEAIREGTLPQALDPRARDAMIDARDIARAAAAGLLNNEVRGPLDLTGPQAIAPQEVAAQLSTLTGRRVAAVALSNEQAADVMQQCGLTAWLIARLLEFRAIQETGAAATTTDGVQRITGQAPRTLATFLGDHAHRFRDPA